MINVGIIEDDELAAARLTEILELYGREKNVALSLNRFVGAESVIGNHTGDFDVLFIDIELSGIDGMSAAKEIRKSDEKVIIVFVTNVAARRGRVLCRRARLHRQARK